MRKVLKTCLFWAIFEPGNATSLVYCWVSPLVWPSHIKFLPVLCESLMSCWCPIFVNSRWSQVIAFIFFSHRLFVLFLTFCAYVCYHASRKPISVVKNELCHCSAINGSSNCTSWICKLLLFILLLLCVRLKLLFFVFICKRPYQSFLIWARPVANLINILRL